MLRLNSGKKSHVLFAMTGACGVTGGIATANLNILRALVELVHDKGIELTIFSFLEKNTDRPGFLPDKVRFNAFQGNKFALSASLVRFAIRKPVCCFDHVTLALPVLPFAAVGAIKTIIFAHGSESWKRLRKTSQWSFRCASLCLTNSHFTLRNMRKRFSRLNGVSCPLGLSPEFPLHAEITDGHVNEIELEAVDGNTYPLGKRVLLLVARMDHSEGQKGHRALINVMPELLSEFPDVQLVFPGPGDDRKNLQELAKRTGVASSVFQPGFVSVETLQSLYRHCYAFVMPSKQEGFGLAYLEAMNYAKPCVGCFEQGAEDIIVHGETGFLVQDPNDTQALLGVLRNLLGDLELARRLGRNGFERLHKGFTARHYQARIKEQIARVL